MTVASEINHNQHVGNGVTTSFDYGFRIFKNSHLLVQVSDLDGVITTLVQGTDYTVTGVGSSGGKVVLTNPLATGWAISIDRNLPIVQETDLRNQGTFYAETHEDAFDYLTMLIQRVYSYFTLALRKPSWLAKFYDAQGNRISDLADPTSPQDAVTKIYSDSQAESNLGKTLRVPDNYIAPLPPLSSLEGKVIGFAGGKPIGLAVPSGSAADVLLQLAATDGAKLSLSQVATAYGLDFSEGGIWAEGEISTVDNWWWYNNKIYTGGSGALSATPSAPWYPVRPGYKLNLTDFITSKGSTDVLDVVDWQWAFNSAKLNAKHSSIIEMDAREYTMSFSGYVVAQGVGMRGPKDAMMNPSLDGVAVLYINKPPSATDVFITMRGGNVFEDFGIFFAQQVYSTLQSVVDTGTMFKRVPASGIGDAILTKACLLRGVSACGVAKLWSSSAADNASGEYDEIMRVSATPSTFGPTFRYGISTDFLRTKTVHINANVVSAYRAKYGVDFTVRALNSSNVSAMGFLIERMDGGVFEDVLTYGVPFPVVFGAVGSTGGANGAGANFVSCGFDATCFPIYINCPAGAFGISISNCQFVFDEQFGDVSGSLIYFGVAASAHHVMLSNVKVQRTANFNYRLLRAVSGSFNNRVLISNSALTSNQDSLDEGIGNRLSVIGSTRNLNSINMMTNTTSESTLMSSMGELNTVVRQQVAVNITSGSTFANINVIYPYTGWNSVPNILTEISVVSISGQPDSTIYGARTFSRTLTGCTLRISLSSAAVATGTVAVDLYILGTIRGVLTPV